MPRIRLDLSEAQFADNLLFDMIDRLTTGVERSKSRALYRESLDMRKEATLTQEALGSLQFLVEHTDGSVEGYQQVLNALKNPSAVHQGLAAFRDMTKRLIPYIEKQKGIAQEREGILREAQVLGTALAKSRKGDLVPTEVTDNTVKMAYDLGGRLRISELVIGKEITGVVNKVLKLAKEKETVSGRLESLDVDTKTSGIQLRKDTSKVVQFWVNESQKLLSLGDITGAGEAIDKANAARATVLSEKQEVTRKEIFAEREARQRGLRSLPIIVKPAGEKDKKGRLLYFDTVEGYNRALSKFEDYKTERQLYLDEIERLDEVLGIPTEEKSEEEIFLEQQRVLGVAEKLKNVMSIVNNKPKLPEF